MSFIAGVMSLTADRLPPDLAVELRAALGRRSGSVFAHVDSHCSVLQLDHGAFGEPGVRKDDRAITILAGHPLFPGDRAGAARDRNRGASALHEADPHELEGVAASATGVWAGARLDIAGRRLSLLTDRTGARPVYWWANDRIVAFSSTLAFLENLAFVPLEVDMQGLVEQLTLGYSLGDRTPYVGIRRILGGEHVRFGPDGVRRSHYYQWHELPERPVANVPHRSEETLELLRRAVDRRNGEAQEAVTFLSGGLDSRVLNYLLRERGITIRSFNFTPPEVLDGALARRFASALDLDHTERPELGGVSPDFARSLASAWADRTGTNLAGRPPVWSGDGGSVCGGWVYVQPAVVQAMRAGRTAEAVVAHLRRYAATVPARDVVPDGRGWVAEAVGHGVVEELGRHPAEDPARRFFFFLVANDQRRHLDRHFEGILDHGVEFWTPFFDAAFLESALSVPVDDGVGHGYYMRWFHLLPDIVRSVPWQTYPGHEPCPLPVPEGLTPQWDGPSPAVRRAERRLATARGLEALRTRFPSEVFRRPRFLFRLALHLMRVRDSGSFFTTLTHFNRYWLRAAHAPLPWQADGATR